MYKLSLVVLAYCFAGFTGYLISEGSYMLAGVNIVTVIFSIVNWTILELKDR